MLRLLGRRTSANVQKVAWLLTEMKIAFQREDVGGAFGGNRTATYLRLNPNGVVPVLIDGDTAVWESNTILRYVANRFGPTGFYPSKPAARAACECWMDWQLGTLNLCMTPLYIELVRTSVEKRDADRMQQYHDRASALFGLLDTELAETAFLAGDALTLADICNGVFAYRWFALNRERRRERPHLTRWFEAIEARPAFQDFVAMELS